MRCRNCNNKIACVIEGRIRYKNHPHRKELYNTIVRGVSDKLSGKHTEWDRQLNKYYLLLCHYDIQFIEKQALKKGELDERQR